MCAAGAGGRLAGIAFAKNLNVVETLRATLGAGESQAIALAQELASSLLLMDEAAGRDVAERLHLDLMGTTGLLLRDEKAVPFHGLNHCLMIWCNTTASA